MRVHIIEHILLPLILSFHPLGLCLDLLKSFSTCKAYENTATMSDDDFMQDSDPDQ